MYTAPSGSTRPIENRQETAPDGGTPVTCCRVHPEGSSIAEAVGVNVSPATSNQSSCKVTVTGSPGDGFRKIEAVIVSPASTGIGRPLSNVTRGDGSSQCHTYEDQPRRPTSAAGTARDRPVLAPAGSRTPVLDDWEIDILDACTDSRFLFSGLIR